MAASTPLKRQKTLAAVFGFLGHYLGSVCISSPAPFLPKEVRTITDYYTTIHWPFIQLLEDLAHNARLIIWLISYKSQALDVLSQIHTLVLQTRQRYYSVLNIWIQWWSYCDFYFHAEWTSWTDRVYHWTNAGIHGSCTNIFPPCVWSACKWWLSRTWLSSKVLLTTKKQPKLIR